MSRLWLSAPATWHPQLRTIELNGPKSESSIGVPLVATTVVTFACFVERIDELRIYDFTGLVEIVEQPIAFNLLVRLRNPERDSDQFP